MADAWRQETRLAGANELDASTSTDDPRRQPGGTPHIVIGMTALFVPVFAILTAVVLATGHWGFAALLALVSVPVLVLPLGRKARRERARQNPSR